MASASDGDDGALLLSAHCDESKVDPHELATHVVSVIDEQLRTKQSDIVELQKAFEEADKHEVHMPNLEQEATVIYFTQLFSELGKLLSNKARRLYNVFHSVLYIYGRLLQFHEELESAQRDQVTALRLIKSRMKRLLNQVECTPYESVRRALDKVLDQCAAWLSKTPPECERTTFSGDSSLINEKLGPHVLQGYGFSSSRNGPFLRALEHILRVKADAQECTQERLITLVRLHIKYCHFHSRGRPEMKEIWNSLKDLEWPISDAAYSPRQLASQIIGVLGQCKKEKLLVAFTCAEATGLFQWLVGLTVSDTTAVQDKYLKQTLADAWTTQLEIRPYITDGQEWNVRAAFCYISEHGQTTTLEPELLVKIAKECHGWTDILFSNVLRKYTERFCIREALQLTRKVLQLPACTDTQALSLQHGLNSLLADKHSAKDKIPLEDIRALFDDQRCREVLCLPVVTSLFKGHSILLRDTTNSKLQELGRLVDDIDNWKKSFLTEHIHTVLQFFSKHNKGFVFNILKLSRALRSIELSVNEAQCVTNKVGTDLSQRSSQPSEGDFHDYLFHAARVLDDNQAPFKDNLLSNHLWQALCGECHSYCQRLVNTDAGSAVSQLAIFVSRCDDFSTRLDPFLWLLFEKLVPKSGTRILWMYDGMQTTMQKFKQLHNRLSSPDSTAYTPNFFSWFDTVKQNLKEHHCRLVEETYTEQDCGTHRYMDMLPRYNSLFAVFGWGKVDCIQSFKDWRNVLEGKIKFLFWLRKVGVAGVEVAITAASQVKDTTAIQFKNLRSGVKSASSHTTAFEDDLRPSGSLDRELVCSIEQYVTAALRGNSKIFRELTNTMIPATGRPPTEISNILILVRSVDELLGEILSCTLTLERLWSIRETVSGIRIQQEVENLPASIKWLYPSSLSSSQVDMNLATGLHMIHCNSAYPAMRDVFLQVGAIEGSTSVSSDAELQLNMQLSVKELLVTHERVCELYQKISLKHLHLMEKLSTKGDFKKIIPLLQEQQWHNEGHWSSLQERLSWQTRGNPVKTRLLDALINTYRSLLPLRLEQPGNVGNALLALANVDVNDDSLSCFQDVCDNIFDLQMLFREVLSTSLENALYNVQNLQASGWAHFYLNGYCGESPSFEFKFSFGNAESALVEHDIFNLRQQLYFHKHDSRKQETAVQFLGVMDGVMDVKKSTWELDRCGFGAYLGTRHFKCKLDTFSTSERQKDLQGQLKHWQCALGEARSSSSAMSLLSSQQISQLLCLLWGDKQAACVIRLMMGNAEQYPNADQQFLTVVRCIQSIVHSVVPLCTLRRLSDNPEEEEVIRCTLVKSAVEMVSSDKRVKKDLQYLSDLLSSMVCDSETNHKGQQTVCFFDPLMCKHLHLSVLTMFLEHSSIPCRYQVLMCGSDTTCQAVQQFITAANKFAGKLFLLVGVDKLLHDVQHCLVHLQRQQDELIKKGTICYVSLVDSPIIDAGYRLTKTEFPELTMAQAKEALPQSHHSQPRIGLYCGSSGSGKSRHIFEMDCDRVICINDMPNIGDIIASLNSLTMSSAKVHFDISSLAPMEEVDGIFFQLLAFGSLVDPEYGTTFSFPPNLNWQWFIEVPFLLDKDENITDPGLYVSQFLPVLALFATECHLIPDSIPFHLSEEDEFVAECVVTHADIGRRSCLPYVGNCEALQTSGLISATHGAGGDSSRLTEAMGLRYLYQQCEVFKRKAYSRTSDATRQAPCLFRQFCSEAKFLSGKNMSCSWRDCTQMFCLPDHTGLHYLPVYKGEYSDPNSDFYRLTHGGQSNLPSPVHDRWAYYFHWMLDVEKDRVQHLLKEKKFILTADFGYKMLLLHMRRRIGTSVILQSNTGTGKTFLLEMYAILLNESYCVKHSHKGKAKTLRLLSRVCLWLRGTILKTPAVLAKYSGAELDPISSKLEYERYDLEDIVQLWQKFLDHLAAEQHESLVAHHNDAARLTTLLQKFVTEQYNTLKLLKPEKDIVDLANVDRYLTDQESCKLLRGFLETPSHPLVWRMLVHPDRTLRDIQEFLEPIIALANEKAGDFVVFFDELNTSSCLGLLNELFVDRRLNGKALPDNIFLVGATNPSLNEAHSPVDETVYRHIYTVHELPLSMRSILWDYNVLEEVGELETYLRAVIDVNASEASWCALCNDSADFEDSLKFLVQLVLKAHMYVKDFVGRLAVSQRDIQRVLPLVSFFLTKDICSIVETSLSRLQTAACLATAVVYYLRLPELCCNEKPCRTMFEQFIADVCPSFRVIINSAIKGFATRFHFKIPTTTALTRGLQENIFAMVTCIQTAMPLAVIGAPGLSKTLSFHIVKGNLRGQSSPTEFCKQFDRIESLYYQCSEHSEANEIERVMETAVARQAVYDRSQPASKTRCVVLLDEAGLLKEDKRSMVLKALHPWLDDCKVSFVAISNRDFDLANQNRMAKVLRHQPRLDDLVTLALGCMGLKENIDEHSETTKSIVKGMCHGFLKILESNDLNTLFHYRDMIYFCRHLGHHRNLLKTGGQDAIEGQDVLVSREVFLDALKRNFSGGDEKQFCKVAGIFLNAISNQRSGVFLDSLRLKATLTYNIIDILSSAFGNTAESTEDGSGVRHCHSSRFKMVIDPTDDLSAVRILQENGLLNTTNAMCKIICMSNLPDDCDQVHAAEAIAEVKYFVELPSTVVLANCSRIFGSLYDLLNQNYLWLATPTVCSNSAVQNTSHQLRRPLEQAYANIGMGLMEIPSRVNSQFQCVVIIRQCDITSTPAPFLSRFEKYLLSLEAFLEVMIQRLPETEQLLVREAIQVCQKFVTRIGKESFYGYKEDTTLYSLFISHIRCRDDEVHFEFCSPALKKLQEEAHHTFVFNNCTELQKIVRCVCAELLQLLPPEIFLRKLPALGEANIYAYIYFKLLDCNHKGVPEMICDRVPADDSFSNGFVPDCPRKLMIFARQSAALWSLQDIRTDASYSARSPHLQVLFASDSLSKRDIEAKLLAYKKSDQTCCVVVADVRKITDLRVWHCLISDAGLVNSHGVSKSFILLFAVPHNEVHTRSCYAASFLTGWNCCYLDSVSLPKIQIHNFYQIFTTRPAEYHSNADTTQRGTITAAAVVPENELVPLYCQSACSDFTHALRTPSRRCPFPESSNAPGAEFYRELFVRQLRAAANHLAKVMQRYPAIWSAVRKQLYIALQDAAIFQLIHRIAMDIISGKCPCSLAYEVDRQMQNIIYIVFSQVMITLCNDYGLATISNWSDETIKCLLDFIPPLSDSELHRKSETSDLMWSIKYPVDSIPKIPLMRLISSRIEFCVTGMDNKPPGIFAKYMCQDQQLAALLAVKQGESLQQAYCTDYLLLNLYQKSSRAPSKQIREKLVKILTCWLEREWKSYQMQPESFPLMAVLHWRLVRSTNNTRPLDDLVSIFSVFFCLEGNHECSLETLWPCESPTDIVKTGFELALLLKALRRVWEELLRLGDAGEENWPTGLSRWISAYGCISSVDFERYTGYESAFPDSADRHKYSILQLFSKILCVLPAPTGITLVLSADRLLARLQTQFLSEAFIHHVISLVAGSGLQQNLKPGLLFTLFEYVLSLVQTEQLQKTEITAVLQLLNDTSKLGSDDVQQYRQVTFQILRAMRCNLKRKYGNTEADEHFRAMMLEEGNMSVTGTYTPFTHVGHDPSSFPLAHALFEERCCEGQDHISRSKHLLLSQIQRPEMLCSLEMAAARHILLEYIINSFARQGSNKILDDSLMILEKCGELALQPTSATLLYILKNAKKALGRSGLKKWLKESSSASLVEAASELHYSEADESDIGLSFMFSSVEASSIGYCSILRIYSELRMCLKKCDGGNFTELVTWCKSQFSQTSVVDGIPIKSCLKGVLFLAAYYEYYRVDKHSHLSRLFSTLQQHLPELGLRSDAGIEQSAYKLFMSDSHDAASTPHFQEVFNRSNGDRSGSRPIDGVLVNFLVCNLFLATGSHWTTLLCNPKDIMKSYWFGSTKYRDQTVRTTRVPGFTSFFLDCQSQFDENGIPPLLPTGFSARSAHVSTFFTFAALFWHTLLVDEAQPSQILNKDFVKKERKTSKFPSYRDKVLQFCVNRIHNMTSYLENGKGMPNGQTMSQDQCRTFLTCCMEKFSLCQLPLSSPFKRSYVKPAVRQAAESEFHGSVVEWSYSHVTGEEHSAQETELQCKLADYSVERRVAVTRDQLQRLVGTLDSTLTHRLPILKHIAENIKKLSIVNLLPKLLAFHSCLHRYCSGNYLNGTSIGIAMKESETVCQALKDGMAVFNCYHTLSGGNLQYGACDVTNEFRKLDQNSPLKDTAETLSAILVFIVGVQCEFFEFCRSQTDLPSNVRAAVEIWAYRECTDVENLDYQRGEGLLKVDKDAVEKAIQRCCYQQPTSGSCTIDGERLQCLLVRLICGEAYNFEHINYESYLRKELLYVAIIDEFKNKSLGRKERLNAGLHEAHKKQPTNLQYDGFRAFVAGHFGYEQSYRFLHILARVSKEFCHPRSPPNEESPGVCESSAETPLSVCIDDLKLRPNTGLSPADMRLTSTILRSLGLTLGHIQGVHSIVCEHLKSVSYIKSDLPANTRVDFSPAVKNQFKSSIGVFFKTCDPQQQLAAAEEAIQTLLNSKEEAEKKPCEELRSVVDSTQCNGLLDCLSSDVKCKNLAAVLSILIDESHSCYNWRLLAALWDKERLNAWYDTAAVEDPPAGAAGDVGVVA